MLNKEQFYLMSQVADRGLKLSFNNGLNRVKKLDLLMDLEYTHDETPLDFEKLLAFDDGDFAHDIIGIYENFNRTTLKMDNCFSPRCTLHVEDRVNSKINALGQALINEIDESGLGRDSI